MTTKPRPARPGMPLSERQVEVVSLIAEGLTNRQIGKRLYVTEDTVKTIVGDALTKLRARNRTHLVALAIRSGII